MKVAYPCPPRHSDADVSVFRAGSAIEPGAGATYREVLNPYGRAKTEGLDLLALLDANPSQGDLELARLAQDTASALAEDVDGIFYRLVGACPAKCTPMQYGGHFLEVDRELLTAVSKPVIVFVEGANIYLDFVSDLPCQWMAWDTDENSISLDEAKAMRSGLFLLAGGLTEDELILGREAAAL